MSSTIDFQNVKFKCPYCLTEQNGTLINESDIRGNYTGFAGGNPVCVDCGESIDWDSVDEYWEDNTDE